MKYNVNIEAENYIYIAALEENILANDLFIFNLDKPLVEVQHFLKIHHSFSLNNKTTPNELGALSITGNFHLELIDTNNKIIYPFKRQDANKSQIFISTLRSQPLNSTKEYEKEKSEIALISKVIPITEIQFLKAFYYAYTNSTNISNNFVDIVRYIQDIYAAISLPNYFTDLYSHEELSSMNSLAARNRFYKYNGKDYNYKIVSAKKLEEVAEDYNLTKERIEEIIDYNNLDEIFKTGLSKFLILPKKEEELEKIYDHSNGQYLSLEEYISNNSKIIEKLKNQNIEVNAQTLLNPIYKAIIENYNDFLSLSDKINAKELIDNRNSTILFNYRESLIQLINDQTIFSIQELPENSEVLEILLKNIEGIRTLKSKNIIKSLADFPSNINIIKKILSNISGLEALFNYSNIKSLKHLQSDYIKYETLIEYSQGISDFFKAGAIVQLDDLPKTSESFIKVVENSHLIIEFIKYQLINNLNELSLKDEKFDLLIKNSRFIIKLFEEKIINTFDELPSDVQTFELLFFENLYNFKSLKESDVIKNVQDFILLSDNSLEKMKLFLSNHKALTCLKEAGLIINLEDLKFSLEDLRILFEDNYISHQNRISSFNLYDYKAPINIINLIYFKMLGLINTPNDLPINSAELSLVLSYAKYIQILYKTGLITSLKTLPANIKFLYSSYSHTDTIVNFKRSGLINSLDDLPSANLINIICQHSYVIESLKNFDCIDSLNDLPQNEEFIKLILESSYSIQSLKEKDLIKTIRDLPDNIEQCRAIIINEKAIIEFYEIGLIKSLNDLPNNPEFLNLISKYSRLICNYYNDGALQDINDFPNNALDLFLILQGIGINYHYAYKTGEVNSIHQHLNNQKARILSEPSNLEILRANLPVKDYQSFISNANF